MEQIKEFFNKVKNYWLSIPFFSQESLKSLDNYKYGCVDNSVVGEYFYYPYVIQPLIDHVVPTWVAPNVITVSGGIFIILALLTIYCVGIFGRFTHIIIGFLFYLYLTFDTLDGKQARKTHSGSPLGELMDHGVDVLVMGFYALIIFNEFSPSTIQMAYAFFLAFMVFYIPHWVQHQTQKMIFKPWNNPVEMIHIYLLVETIRTVYDITPDKVASTVVLGMPFTTFLLSIFTIIGALSVYGGIQETKEFIESNKLSWEGRMEEIIPFALTNICALGVNYIQIDNFFFDQIRMLGSICFISMFVQWYIVTRLLALPCPKLYINFYVTVGIVIFINIAYYMGCATCLNILCVIYFAHSFFWEAALVTNVIYHFSKFLKIHPFKITPD